MSQARLTLRPPPNIEFVQGFPGIPPGAPDRPQAAVKGAIEVRVAAEGVKAKWVRIELRKIETLPGGGVANTFFDFVGQSPINVWQAREEYGVLHAQDFPFYIRIPESIPPSISLEKGGIKYELIASVCIKGKKGLLRRDKPTITATSTPVMIDKHELHSTWPVYQQPETRSHTEGGVTLTVDRSRTCYGPGDRIEVSAAVKTEALHTGILRGYEFTLRETTVFRGSTHSKKGAPIVKNVHIGEQKVPVNVTLYGGTQHKASLAVTIPTNHASATLTAARHIDITYTLSVKALMGTGKHVTLELPVIVSNWPRAVSLEAMRRIGMAPNVCLPGQGGTGHTHPPPASSSAGSTTESKPISSPIPKVASMTFARPSTASTHPYATADSDTTISRPSAGQFNTVPVEKANGSSAASKPDEFGVTRAAEQPKGGGSDRTSSVASTERSSQYAAQTIGGVPGHSGGNGRIAPYASETTAFARQRASTGRSQARLTIANLNDNEVEEHAKAQRAHSATVQNTSRSKWMTAEDEKKRLYETAVAKVERVQGAVARARSPDDHAQVIAPSDARTVTPATDTKPSTKANGWSTAEEEKARLFYEAQAAVARTQGLNGSMAGSPPPSLHGRSESLTTSPSAIRPSHSTIAQSESGRSSQLQTPRPTKRPSTSQLPSADEEKAVLRRYYEAKAAVERTHAINHGAAPATSPSTSAAPNDAYHAQTTARPGDALTPNGAIPPFVVASPQPTYPSEKEQLRAIFEARDAAAMAGSPPPPIMPSVSALGPPSFVSPSINATEASSPPVASTSTLLSGVAAEKEMLRRRFEAQDAAALIAAGPPAPPPRIHRTSSSPVSRPIPVPPRSSFLTPGSPGGMRPLTAAEEKARLNAQYEAEEHAAQSQLNGNTMSPPAPMTLRSMNSFRLEESEFPRESEVPSAPPPLAPRPPKEYILETQEEDKRTYARLEAIDKEISTFSVPRKTELILSSFSADLVDSEGNPLPTPGSPPPIAPSTITTSSAPSAPP